MNSWSWWISAVSLMLTLFLFVLDFEKTSPGPLSAVHGRETDLAGGEGCPACHGEESIDMNDSCRDCHEEIRIQQDTRKGLHGQEVADSDNDCSHCHSEHHGEDFALVDPKSFILAGIPDPAKYDHAGLDYRLKGKHLELECRKCHELADIDILIKGMKRFLGEDQECVSCHEDPHKGGLGLDCAFCHGEEEPFERAANLDHDSVFPLKGGHAGRACRDCHDAETDHSVTVLVEAIRVQGSGGARPRSCSACHASPHRPNFLAQVTLRTGSDSEDQTCAHCHCAEHETFLGPMVEMDRGLHAAAGFPLSPPHDKVSCEGCHKAFGRRAPIQEPEERLSLFSEIYPGRDPDHCKDCHGDPHGEEFELGPFREEDCLACHDRLFFRPPDFSLDDHAKTRFPLTGAHEAVGCNECHKLREHAGESRPARSVKRIFHGTPADCDSCHRDVHEACFDEPGLPRQVSGESGCARCHTTVSFQHLRAGNFDHAKWTGYALAGGHARAPCEGCHRPSKAPDDLGRRFGRVISTRCESCHEDPHLGQFRVMEGTDCSRCHTVGESFRDLCFDHQKDSRFPLDEQHAKLPCSACHKSYPLSKESTIIRYKPLGTACVDCHIPPGEKGRTPGNRAPREGRRK